jgi:hypothetical protein
MATSEIIEKIRHLSDDEAARFYDNLFSEESEVDRLLAAFDRLPRKAHLTEEEILALPRARSARQ